MNFGLGMARQGLASHGRAGQVKDCQGTQVKVPTNFLAVHGGAGPGMARRGAAGRGKGGCETTLKNSHQFCEARRGRSGRGTAGPVTAWLNRLTGRKRSLFFGT